MGTPEWKAFRESQMNRKMNPKSQENKAANPTFLQNQLLQISKNTLQIKAVMGFSQGTN